MPDARDLALIAAGSIGAIVALIHGYVMQRMIVRPSVRAATEAGVMKPGAIRLIAPLLHVSTFTWFIVGIALIYAGACIDGRERLAISLLGVATYGYAAILNGWATRWRHPGWMLMAIATLLTLCAL